MASNRVRSTTDSALAMLAELACKLLRPYHFRGKLRLLNSLVPKYGERSAAICGYTMRLDLAEHIQRMIFLGCYEAKGTALVTAWLRPGMTVVDVGANVGYYTAMAAAGVGPSGKVVAIEPSAVCDKLEELVKNNGLDWVSTWRIGLSDVAGRLPIYLGDEANYTPTMVAHEHLLPLDVVEVRTLDDLVAETKIERIDLLKMDVEGHEPAILRGAQGLLKAGRIGAILCEFNEYWLRSAGRNPAEFWQSIINAGFRDTTGRAAPRRPVENRFFVKKLAC